MASKLNNQKELSLEELSVISSEMGRLGKILLPSPNYKDWVNLPKWRVWEAIMLLSNITPNKKCFNDLIQPKFLNKFSGSRLKPPFNIVYSIANFNKLC
jgi:hypothetical protein